jgi:uncharacterized protein YukE
MSMIGADLEQMGNLAQTLGRSEQDVERLTSEVNNAVHNTWWKGGTHDRLQQAWEGEIQPALSKLREILGAAQQEVQGFSQALQELDRPR